MATLGDIVVRMRCDVGPLQTGVRQASDALSGFARQSQGAAGQAANAFATMRMGGIAMTGVVTAGMAAVVGGLALAGAAAMKMGEMASDGFRASATEAIKFEQAFAHVTKLLNPANTSFGSLRDSLIDMSRTLPVAATELARLAAVGGQMGIEGNKNLTSFVDTVVRLGQTAEMSGEEAAKMLARIAAVNGIDQSQYNNLASAIIGVATSSNATVPEVMRMTMQMQALAATSGVSAQTMIGLSATMAAAGLRVESAGTAFGRMSKDINIAVLRGGGDLEKFAKVAGMSATEFQKAWKTDNQNAILRFFEGLNASGSRAALVMEDLGWKNVRVSSGGLALAKTVDDLRSNFAKANDEFARGTKLLDQSNEVFQTTSGQLQLLQNDVRAVSIEFGTAMLPAIKEVAAAFRPMAADMITSLREMKPEITAVSSLFASGFSTAILGVYGYFKDLLGLMREFPNVAAGIAVSIVSIGRSMPGGAALEAVVKSAMNRGSRAREEINQRRNAEALGVFQNSQRGPTGVYAPGTPLMLQGAGVGPAGTRNTADDPTNSQTGLDPESYAGKMAAARESARSKLVDERVALDLAGGGPMNSELGSEAELEAAQAEAAYKAEQDYQKLKAKFDVSVRKSSEKTLSDQSKEDNKEAVFNLDKLGDKEKEHAKDEKKRIDGLNDANDKKFRNQKDTLQNVAAMFSVLGIKADSSLGRMVGGFTVAGKAGAELSHVMGEIGSDGKKKGFENLFKTDGKFDVSKGLANATSMVEGVVGVWKAGTAKGAKGILGGAMAGAKLGSAFGPWGTAIGAAGGALMSGIGKLFGKEDPVKAAGKKIAKTLGHSVTDEFATQAIEMSKALGITVEEAAKKIEGKTKLDALMQQQERESAGTSRMKGGLSMLVKEDGSLIGGSGAAQGRIWTQSFWNIVKTDGMVGAVDFFKSLSEKGDAFMPDSIKKYMTAFGQTKDEKTGEMIAGPMREAAIAAQGYGEVLAGMGSAGWVDQASFQDFQSMAVGGHKNAMAGAGDDPELQKAALISQMPLLAKIKQLHDDTGMAIDAETQALIDQAEAQGLAFPVDPMLVIRDVLLEIAKALGATIPDSAKKAGDALRNVKPPGASSPEPTTYQGGEPTNGPDVTAAKGFGPKLLTEDTVVQAHAGERIGVWPKGHKVSFRSAARGIGSELPEDGDGVPITGGGGGTTESSAPAESTESIANTIAEKMSATFNEALAAVGKPITIAPQITINEDPESDKETRMQRRQASIDAIASAFKEREPALMLEVRRALNLA